jgi:alpha-mannosidase
VRIPLEVASDDAIVVTLAGRLDATGSHDVGAPLALRYRTRTGALLRIDGAVRGAFDREHETIALAPAASGTIELEVERRSLPGSGLPPGDGVRWKWIVARSVAEPVRHIETVAPPSRAATAVVHAPNERGELSFIGHSHLDVAWLWTFDATARKAARTFATTVRQLDADPSFVFAQSQPQLYAFVEEREPELFARVRALASAGRIETSVAAMWVEPDCNLPAGESLLRQLVFGIRYCEAHFGTRPDIAWLPDSFGFPNTLPTLLAHAGVGAFATTKLAWNDTTRFPYARFVWEGPDGSAVLAANFASIQGGFERARVATARARGDLLLIGLGDGGGGVRDDALAAARSYGTWTPFATWFAQLRAERDRLPIVRDELYLEAHRGTATSQHAIKARHAALERALGDAELSLAWAKTLRATPFFLDEARAQLHAAWEIVLRAEFHDVLPGSAIADVYADVHREFERAEALVANVAGNARSVLPHAPRGPQPPGPVAPLAERGAFRIANDRLVARVREDGALVDLRVRGGPNLVRRALVLAAYVDRPKKWDAWNVDRSYRRRPVRVRMTGCEATDDGVEIRYAFGASLAVVRVESYAGEPFLRVEIAVDWRERHVLLRLENRLAFAAARARFGTPHGAVDRAPDPRTKAERAKFEAPGQRFARIDTTRDGASGGLALLTLDTYGWSVGRRGRATELGHSLLRGPTWPDPAADAGRHAFSYALLPFDTLGMGELETAWERFARMTEVPMFTSDDPAVVVTATKIADDGDGLVVRARECDGRERDVALRCAARAFGVTCVDALERPAAGEARFEDGAIRARFRPFELRTFRLATTSKPA